LAGQLQAGKKNNHEQQGLHEPYASNESSGLNGPNELTGLDRLDDPNEVRALYCLHGPKGVHDLKDCRDCGDGEGDKELRKLQRR
jgi:hypothetical protein